ncbi:MAG: hypothetical protein C4586_05715 [Anaerolineaceae bacterium]|nr:MAG: hypothetical protein C4586_05715 [Anaerolineaceae bacterium]
MKPYSRVIQLLPENSSKFEDEKTFTLGFYLALCEDGSIWTYQPGLAETNPWHLLSEMDNGSYATFRERK